MNLSESNLHFSEKIPRQGPCSYLVISSEFLKSPLSAEESKLFNHHLSILTSSRDFYVDYDESKNLRILAMSERAIGVLAKWTSTLQKLFNQGPSVFLGKGEVFLIPESSQEAKPFQIKDYISSEVEDVLKGVKPKRPSVYSTRKHLNQIHGSRDETLIRLIEKESPQESSAALPEEDLIEVEIKNQLSLRQAAGPDRLIGYQDEIRDLREHIAPFSQTKLILLEGHAGTGKSRLLHEITAERPNVLSVSMDPAGRNIPGFSMTLLVDQVASFLNQNFADLPSADLPASVKTLMDFQSKNETEKLLEINGFNFVIEHYLHTAVEFIEEKNGSLVFVLDDIHHIDRFSDSAIMKFIQHSLDSELTSNIKFILARRPEARYASLEQKNLEQNIPESARISLHDENGKSKLNFNNPHLANDYVFYSLPENIRTIEGLGSAKFLSGWTTELGKLAKTPFEFTSYLQELIQNQSHFLLIQNDRIDLTPAGLEKIKSYREKDLTIYHLERIREQLSPPAQQVLQLMAIIGKSIAQEEDLIELIQFVLKCDESSAAKHLIELHQKGFISSLETFSKDNRDAKTEILYSIWHENIRDIVLQYGLDLNQRTQLAGRAFQFLENSPDLSSAQKFSLLTFAANGVSAKDLKFWERFTIVAGASLTAAENNKQYFQTFNIASSILDFQSQLDSIDDVISPIVVNRAILSLAQSANFIGRFSETYRAVQLAEEKYGKNFSAAIPPEKIYAEAFQAAFSELNHPLIDKFYQKLKAEELSASQLQLLELRYHYSKNDFEKCKKLISQIERNLEISPEQFGLIKIRIATQNLLHGLSKEGYDGDILYSGNELSDKQKELLAKQLYAAGLMRQSLNKKLNSEKNTQLISPVNELQFLDVESTLNSLLQKHEKAVELYSEAWRLAMQMELFQQAMRFAKLKGDTEMIIALSQIQKNPESFLNRAQIKKAIQTYTETGIKIAEEKGDKTWEFLLSVQRLRAICYLLKDYSFKETRHQREEFIDYLTMGRDDLEFLNLEEYAQFIPKKFDPANISDFETCYYITPLVLCFKRICRQFRVEIEGFDFAFEKNIPVLGSRLFSTRIKDDVLGESKFKKFYLK